MWIYFVFNLLIFGISAARKSKLTYWTVVLLFVLFVGFRFETGTDWQAYKPNYYDIADKFHITEFLQASLILGQEPGFIFLNSLFSYIFPEYEYFQAALTIFFLWSTLHLAKRFGAVNVPLVLATISAYLWMNVEFSTVRQALAISFFNLALAYYLDRRRLFCLFFLFVAVSSHYSSLIYIGLFAFAVYSPPRVTRFIPIIMLAGAAFMEFLLSGAMNNLLPGIVASRITIYTAGRVFNILDPVNMFYLSIFVFGLVTAFRGRIDEARDDNRVRILRNMIVLFGFAGIAFIYFPIFRDRICYEFIILLAIYVTMPVRKLVKQSNAVVFSWGILFSLYIVLTTNMIPYAPYQNYLVHSILGLESTAQARMDIFLGIGRR